jgi:hypothetical protein
VPRCRHPASPRHADRLVVSRRRVSGVGPEGPRHPARHHCRRQCGAERPLLRFAGRQHGGSSVAWSTFGRDAQHTAQSTTASQPLNRVVWQTPVDLQPQYSGNGSLLAHYGSPLMTAANTIIVPVKTGATGDSAWKRARGRTARCNGA